MTDDDPTRRNRSTDDTDIALRRPDGGVVTGQRGADPPGGRPADAATTNELGAGDPDVRLEARSLAFAYGDLQILEDVSVTATAGDVTALIGPNGTGKTTLLRALAGIHEPTAGTVEYRGPDVPRPIGYLPQRPSFRPGFTVLETLAFYASLVGEDRADAMEHLDRVGLGDAADRRVDALSGGMTRLVGIAQATIGSPPVVVLDEPASGLDPGMSPRVFEVARAVADTGTAVVLTSHDLALVERTADEVLLLDDGVVAERGRPASITARLDVDTLQAAYEASVVGALDRVRVQGESA
ncbi:ABC transporter ATP-binding protein [Salinirubellus salinus]|uniref:ABC transporter ATP-binding protein n=1 Tax=Salinirubellus salinus TaxID=1364945 RepID=A0A9E7R0D6_9EURY|nr:ABC transporter ATP-binding protein [Salinirubellus salinus]UWM53354.1 ABC transporter ATP-binding protein [Salinirubellus salinus]